MAGTSEAAAVPIAGIEPSLADPRDYLALMKPRVMSLVVFTAFVGMALAPGHIHPVLAFTALLCISVGAGAAGALNMWFDADVDALMRRTRARPIPQKRIRPGEAFAFGITLAGFSICVLGLLVSWFAAALLAFTIFFYVAIYTMWLKRTTPQNIVIGGAAGALPPVIGWSAVTGSATLEPWLMFLIVFLWTPPHFWALALTRVDDYARAGIPMLPVVAGADATRRHIVAYSVVLAPVALAPWALGYSQFIYGLVALAGGALMIALSLRVQSRPGDRSAAARLFGFSILYLFTLFAALLIDRGIMGE
jgi:protoheme IX farnesyltransferase